MDKTALRAALGRFCTGVTVVTVAHQRKAHGMTANAFTSVSLDPPLVLVCIDRRSRTHALLATQRQFGISVLSESQLAVSRQFSGAAGAADAIEFDWHDGVPVLAGAISFFVCESFGSHEAGDHMIHVGRVRALGTRPGQPLVYYSGSFARLDVPGRCALTSA